MDKIKFISILLLSVLLFQIPLLQNLDDIKECFYIFISFVVWIIGTRQIYNLSKYTKIVIYGFISCATEPTNFAVH